MDWKKLVEKFRIAEVKAEGKQVGALNINIENKSENRTYHFNFTDPEAAAMFAAGLKVSPDFEMRVKKEAERRLINLGVSPELLSDSTSVELAGVTVAASTLSMMGGTKPDKE